MSATVTPPYRVDKFNDVAPMSGDNLTRLTYGMLDIQKPDGQLWERVAELDASGINYTERMERIKIERIRRAHGYDAQATGEYVKVAHSTRRSGIIRAGVGLR